MITSIHRRARLAFMPLVVILAAQCADGPTSPDAVSLGTVVPSLAVAELASISALEGTPVQFYCGSSSDAEGDPLLCEWDFGNDGSMDAECTTADGICRWDFDHDGTFEGTRAGSFDYSWPDQGTFDVRLDVSDTHGDHSSTTAQATVADVAPIITGRTPLVFDVGETQRIHTRFTDPGADSTWMFVFDFGDGTVIGPRRAPGPNIGFGQFHAYESPGTYVVTVTVTDKDGVVSTLSREVLVYDNQNPVADAGGPYSGIEGTEIALTGAASSDDNGEITYLWDLGDGSRSREMNPSRRYIDDGTYEVRLIVTDQTGAEDTTYTTVVVQNVAPTGTPRVPAVREGSDFTISLRGFDPGNVDRYALEYSLDCGQGAGPTAWSTTDNITCPAPSDQGALTATFSVRDKDGAMATYVRDVTVSNVRPEVTLNATGATTIQVGAALQLEGRYSDPGLDDGPFAYRVNWGDGTSTNGSTPGTMTTTPLAAEHVFTRTGTFTVTLFVTDKDLAMSRSNSIIVTVTP